MELNAGFTRCGARIGSAWLFAAAAVAALAMTAVPALCLDFVATLHDVKGKVDVQRGPTVLPGLNGLSLADQDKVVTGKGRATIRFDDGSEIRLQSETEFGVQQPKGRLMRTFKVFTGRLWARVRSNRSLQTEFESGNVITAIRGTILEYSYDALTGQLKVGCSQGSLIVRFTMGGVERTVIVGAGQMLTLDMGPNADPTAIPQPQPFVDGVVFGVVVKGEAQDFEIQETDPFVEEKKGEEQSSPKK